MDPTQFTRRDFAYCMASGLAGAALASDQSATAQDKKPAAEPAEERDIPEHVYLLGAVLKHYPDKRLDEAAIGGIARDIIGDIARGRVLSKFPLTNADEPCFAFRAWRAEG